MGSLKKNIAYKGLLTISNYLLAFITFPYITRVLGVERFGQVNFALNVVEYFLIFATLGINIIGTREIAAVNGVQKKLNHVFSSIFGMNFVLTIIVSIIFLISIQLITKFNENSCLLYIGLGKIISTCFLVEWFYTGIEKFKYITIRSLLIKILYVISVFIFVKTQTDYILYFLLTVGAVVLNAIVNFLFCRKLVKIDWHDFYNFEFIKPNIILGIQALMSSTYMTFNVMWLGLVSTDVQVGYYTTAFRLYFIAISLFGAYTAVMIPRMSAIVAEGNNELFRMLLRKSFKICILFCIPIIIVGIIFTPFIIYLVAGHGYEGAIMPMRIIMPAVLFVCIAQVIALQILVPFKKDKVLLVASIAGASLALIFNFIFVKNYGAIGSALTLSLSEFCVTSIYLIYYAKFINHTSLI